MVESFPVQATNDSSSISKLSAIHAGFLSDPFLIHFVTRPQRRAPLIHWGYYIRARAVDHVISTFLSHHDSQKTQIISLGAGFDSSYFRLAQEGRLDHCHYVEVDFPAVVSRKLNIIQSIASLRDMADRGKYMVIGCDITALERLEVELMRGGVDHTLPTLLLAEVVLTYIKPEHVDALLHWASDTFPDACFCAYEQVCPEDGFGGVMLRHFQSISSPLLNIHLFPSVVDQQQRYHNAGWSLVEVCDMNQFFHSLPESEYQRLLSLEMFDEFEELHLKCGHYMLLCAFNGTCRSLSSSLSFPPSPVPTPGLQLEKEVELICCRVTKDEWKLKRFGHCSVLLSSGHILVYGGFGYRDEAGAHGRLDSLVLVRREEEREEEDGKKAFAVEDGTEAGQKPPGLLHHTMTLLPDGSVLLVGGRVSPCQPNPHLFLLRPGTNGERKWVWSTVGTNEALARWRHSATLMSSGCVVIVGGCSVGGRALSDIHMIDCSTWEVNKLPVVLPVGRHSHTAAKCGDDLIILGGLDSFLRPLSSGLRLSSRQSSSLTSQSWNITELRFNPPLPARYSMVGECVRDHKLVLVGGVQTQHCPTPSVIIANLATLTWYQHPIVLPPSLPIPLLHNLTAHWLEEEGQMILLGGGGNCFSFGTHFNTSPLLLNGLQT